MRPSMEDTLFNILTSIGLRSTCDRGHASALIVRDGRIVSTGWSGAPSGMPHCDEIGHLIDPRTGGCVRTIHAEQNAICWAARKGISVEGTTMFCTMTPCYMCAKSIVASGIKQVYCQYHYRDEIQSLALFIGAQIQIAWKFTDMHDYPREEHEKLGIPGSGD